MICFADRRCASWAGHCPSEGVPPPRPAPQWSVPTDRGAPPRAGRMPQVRELSGCAAARVGSGSAEAPAASWHRWRSAPSRSNPYRMATHDRDMSNASPSRARAAAARRRGNQRHCLSWKWACRPSRFRRSPRRGCPPCAAACLTALGQAPNCPSRAASPRCRN